MSQSPKRIDFPDIRIGDKIRVVDVREIEVRHAGVEGLYDLDNRLIARKPMNGATVRSFQLHERTAPPIPTHIGAVIDIEGDRYVLAMAPHRTAGGWIRVISGLSHSAEGVQDIANRAGGFEVIA